MPASTPLTRNWILLGAVVAAALVVWLSLPDRQPPEPAAIVVPQLSARAQTGQAAFGVWCAQCHGANAEGTDQGPPLIHIIYEPSHHSDASFHLAARQGVRAHHWGFGDMPAVEGIGDAEIEAIIDFVREVQRANGIK